MFRVVMANHHLIDTDSLVPMVSSHKAMVSHQPISQQELLDMGLLNTVMVVPPANSLVCVCCC